MKKIVIEEKCPACNGTGLYVGMAERDGFAVVCHQCGGTGKYTFFHEYENFERREERRGIRRVLETNCGICVGTRNGYNIESFGGMPYKEWLSGFDFPPKSEMREFTCPVWWYQSANYELKPDWDECVIGRSFSDCPYFKNKEKCWDRFDKEKK